MKKIIVFIFMAAFLSVGVLFAGSDKAVVESFSGKVEYQSADGTWQPVTGGMQLPLKSVISTGFNSKVVLNLGQSTLYVEPLSRMSIENLVEKDGVVSTDLFLQVGKVKSEVRSVKGLQNDFKVRSPITTASVRGTVFSFDSVTLDVDEGVVVFTDRFKQEITALAGEKVENSGDGSGQIYTSIEITENEIILSSDTSDICGPQGLGNDGSSLVIPKADLEYGSLRVTWNVNQ